MGTKDSITEDPKDTHEKQTGAAGATVVVLLVLLGVVVLAVAVWVYRSKCPRHWTYTGTWPCVPADGWRLFGGSEHSSFSQDV